MTQQSDISRELVERVEALSGPDREIDALIWLACVPGATRRETRYTHKASGKECVIDETRENGRLIIVPEYSGSLDAALSLIPEGYDWGAGFGVDPDAGVPHGWGWIGKGEGPYVFAASSAIALTAAALRARTQEAGQSPRSEEGSR